MKRSASRSGKALSPEDRVLWHRVASTTQPLHGSASLRAIMAEAVSADEKAAEDVRVAKAAGELKSALENPADYKPAAQNPALPAFNPIDRTQKRKLARGRLPIEARIDLHGLFQNEAHDQLLDFLSRASARGLRHVLVITGKGSSPQSRGVLARMVPQWLATPPFRLFVSGHEQAARQHGGSGALYIRLRRKG